jgi:tRNA (cmo5U34)-methyltransferase
MTAQDTVFRDEIGSADFTFDAKVSHVFDDMVARSVPFYSEVQRMQAELAMELLPDGDCTVCDLGCSTGTTIDLLISHARCPAGAEFVGVDSSPHMLKEAAIKLGQHLSSGRVKLVNADLNSTAEIPRCDLILMNWTLQFVRPLYRESLVRRVFESLKPGGALFLSEKALVSDSMLNRLYIDFYLRYKKGRGYSDLEIHRKREALENVLVPYRIEENITLLQNCGFKAVDTYFRWFNFACFVALKGAGAVRREAPDRTARTQLANHLSQADLPVVESVTPGACSIRGNGDGLRG